MKTRTVMVTLQVETELPLVELRRRETWQGRVPWIKVIRQVQINVAQQPKKKAKR